MLTSAVRIACMLVIGAALTCAIPAAGSAQQVNATNGIALQGYDPVAYFTEGKPQKGSAKFAASWSGVQWHFATALHRDLFAADPEKYAPRYGGFCAYGVSQGVKVGFDPRAWRIVDGGLYLNLNPSVQRTWVKDIPGYIALADANWTALRDK